MGRLALAGLHPVVHPLYLIGAGRSVIRLRRVQFERTVVALPVLGHRRLDPGAASQDSAFSRLNGPVSASSHLVLPTAALDFECSANAGSTTCLSLEFRPASTARWPPSPTLAWCCLLLKLFR